MTDPSTTGLPKTCFKEISNWVNSILNIDQLLELFIDTATRMMGAKAASLLLYDEKRKKLYFKVATGEKGEEVKQFELNLGEGIAGYVAQMGEPLLIPDVKKDPRWDRTISESSGFETTSIACVPLKIDEKIIGVVEVIDKEDGSPIRQEDLSTLTVISDLASTAIVNARVIDRFKRENEGLKEELCAKYEVIGESSGLKRAVSEALKVAHSKASTLILGESGAGKEVVAKLIHRASSRNSMPMVMLNCAALPESLFESELFGHEKGAFTGAVDQKIGKFELADGGTLFLDEIGEMPLVMQAKLLRVLQEGVFYRVGGVDPISVDVRIIASTNKEIEREVKEGNFREDLYYRLNVVQIRMPALKERKEDVPLLASHFLNRFSAGTGYKVLKVSEGAMKKMMAYDWPGNVRELKNAIERAVVMGNGKEILAKDIPLSPAPEKYLSMAVGLSLKDAVDGFKKEYIRQNLEHAAGNRTKAAKVLDIQRTYLSRLISRYGI